MSIEYPETFGEAFWKPQVDATKFSRDEIEKSISVFIKSILDMFSGYDGVPTFFTDIMSGIGQPGNFGLAAVAESATGNAVSSVIGNGLAPQLRLLTQAINSALPTQILEIDNAATLRFRRVFDEETYQSIARRFGYAESMAEAIYASLMPYPEIGDIISYVRYNDPHSNVIEKAQTYVNFPSRDELLWDHLSRIQPNLSDLQSAFVRGDISQNEIETWLLKLGYVTSFVPELVKMSYSLPNASLLLQSSLFRGEPFDVNERYVALGGIQPEYAPHFIDGMLTKPDVTTIVRYLLRTDPNLNQIERELKRIGIHPDYIDMFRTLAYPVPPVADLITMAVREAFSPSIASRFGQYEDYPTDLTKFAEQQGISEEWSKRYWAAHWSLPSPQQGFEMLHRGVIDEGDLQLLLRALDIMPFWRDKLTQISYNPLTRVDVRRMYALGVLSETEVTKAYRDIGYTQENAGRLREFTVRQTIASQSGLSVSKAITAYKNGYATRQDTYNAISRLGVRPQIISDVIESADLQLDWQRNKDKIAAIRNLFKKERINEGQARNELSSLRLDSNKIDLLISQWVNEAEDAHGTLLSKTDVLSMVKKGLMNRTRASQELSLLGYTTERSNLLLATLD